MDLTEHGASMLVVYAAAGVLGAVPDLDGAIRRAERRLTVLESVDPRPTKEIEALTQDFDAMVLARPFWVFAKKLAGTPIEGN